MQISKLYSYYLGKLFRKNWLKMLIFFFVSVVLVGFLFWWVIFTLVFKGKNESYKIGDKKYERKIEAFKAINELFTTEKEMKSFREKYGEEKNKMGEEYKKVKENGDETKIKKIEDKIKDSDFGAEGFTMYPPAFKWEINDFFLETKGTSEGKSFWKLINNISFGALTGGLLFSWLTLQMVDFLFLRPKKDGNEREVLTYLPGVSRNDLLISKILVFLTYYVLLVMVTLVLPMLFYYSGVGAVTPFSSFAGLFLYALIVAPLLVFGLVILPYMWINSISSTLGSVFSGVGFLGGLMVIPNLKRFFIFFHHLENGFFNPYIFTPLAILMGLVCFYFYYSKTQSEDLGT